MEMKQNIKGLDYFCLALLAFAGLGLELLLVLIEPMIYKRQVEFNDWTIISHWILTCILWGTAIFFIVKFAMNRYGFRLKESADKPEIWKIITVAGLVVLSFCLSYISWDGFKVLKELEKLGALKFSLQYLYYFFETALFTLIIVFGQKAFEKWFKNDKIPYGGII